MPKHLSANIRHRIGALELNTQFDLAHPWTILFGPSGSGKTTILRIIAGLTPARTSTITLNNRNLSTEPAHQRRIALLPQTPSLFPHLTAKQNVAFATRTNADTFLKLFHADHLANSYPAQLSGGEQQRIVLARAVASTPHLLLLDEPFTGLDHTLRTDLIAALKTWSAETNTPILQVTHDVAEAFELNAEVLILTAGRITAQGPPQSVLAEARTRLLQTLT